MKNTNNKFLALILIATVALFSCKKVDPLPTRKHTYPTTTTSQSTDNPTLTRGYWMVGSFQKGGVDRTNDFRGYLFIFNGNGKINVSKDSISVDGSWATVQNNDSRKKFVINFSSDPLNAMNLQWLIKSETFNDLKLEHLNESGGSADNLTFKRYQQQ